MPSAGTGTEPPRGKYSSWWMGVCNVCDAEAPVTEVRDFRYLNRGIVELVEGAKV